VSLCGLSVVDDLVYGASTVTFRARNHPFIIGILAIV
jgi:hypothetical protein